MEINVLFEAGLDGSPPPKAWLRHVIERVLLSEGSDAASEVSLVIAGQQTVQGLNQQYLGEDHPTDVLSFPMTPFGESRDGFVGPPDGLRHLGEIMLSLPQATAQAREHGHPVRREIALLIVHGVLHLLGYDHDEPEREQQMRAREHDIMFLLDSEAIDAPNTEGTGESRRGSI